MQALAESPGVCTERGAIAWHLSRASENTRGLYQRLEVSFVQSRWVLLYTYFYRVQHPKPQTILYSVCSIAFRFLLGASRDTHAVWRTKQERKDQVKCEWKKHIVLRQRNREEKDVRESAWIDERSESRPKRQWKMQLLLFCQFPTLAIFPSPPCDISPAI